METKRCPKCCQTLPISDYASNKRKNRKCQISAYCKSCLCQITAEKHKIFKIKCLDILGSKCSRCGYNKCWSALDFHHLDPDTKEFQFSTHFKNLANLNDDVRKELQKCVILCANCHREEHTSI